MVGVAPLPGRAPGFAEPRHPYGRLARSAVAISALAGVAFPVAVAAVAIPYAIGKGGAVDDTTIGLLLIVIMVTGLLLSAAAFLMAIAAVVRRVRWGLLWLPLAVFPAIVLFVVLGEAFWWE
jgi:hypothetical protein